MTQTSISNLLLRMPGLLNGLSVRAQDGTKLGHVIKIGQAGLEIQKGVIARRYYYIDFVEITSAFGGSIYLWRGSEGFVPLPNKMSAEELELFEKEHKVAA